MQPRSSARCWIATGAATLVVCSGLGTARAAHITDVADAADTILVGETEREDLFDLYVGTTFSMQLDWGTITREPIVDRGMTISGGTCQGAAASRDCLPVNELKYKRQLLMQDIDLQIGLFHDLAVTAGFHYVLSDVLKFDYADGVSATNSTVDPGDAGASDPALDLFKHDYQSKHKGLRSVDLGLRFAPLNDERDDSKPAWVVWFNWAMPFFYDVYKPKTGQERPSLDKPGPVGDGVHRLTFATALSKRVGSFGMIGIDPAANRRGYVDPYLEVSYTLPLPDDRAPKELKPSKDFRVRPSHEARLNAGMEIVAVEDLRNSRKVAIDLGMRHTFFSEGRNYSVLTDPLEELTYTEQYFVFGGLLGLYVQAAEFVHFRAGVLGQYTTEHFLTFEDVGIDGDPKDGQVTENPPDIKNHLWNEYYDQVGRRFKDERHWAFAWFANLLFTF